tara:strand:- start:644 stop:1177 length:534 start_codon:yes stop_codon:yes gene_type:complete
MRIVSESSKILSNEHKNILKVIGSLEKEHNHIESGKKIDKDFFEKIIDFIRNYADKFHHAKEEDILFKEFSKCVDEGRVHCNPTEQMLYEHDLGRNFVKGMEQGVNEDNREKVIKNIKGYSELLKEHIYKEDSILYPMADEALDKKVKDLVLKKFERVERERKEDNEKYLKIVNGLK